MPLKVGTKSSQAFPNGVESRQPRSSSDSSRYI
jgi:hypothetical protein